jgi:hypothetical protein
MPVALVPTATAVSPDRPLIRHAGRGQNGTVRRADSVGDDLGAAPDEVAHSATDAVVVLGEDVLDR